MDGGGGQGGLIRFCREIAGVGLTFPRADRLIAIDYPGAPIVTLHPITGIEFVVDTVTALSGERDLADHLFRQCWATGACGQSGGKSYDRILQERGWSPADHRQKVARAAELVATWHNDGPRNVGNPDSTSQILRIDPAPIGVSDGAHGRCLTAVLSEAKQPPAA
jgi:hypothetical protein